MRALLDRRELIDALADGFRALSAGELATADRTGVALPGGDLLLSMPGALPDGDLTVKVVTLFERNAPPLPTHQATIAPLRRATGACRAFMDGTHITALRTAAASALAARASRARRPLLLVVGAGVQARAPRRAAARARLRGGPRRGAAAPRGRATRARVPKTSRPRCAPPT